MTLIILSSIFLLLLLIGLMFLKINKLTKITLLIVIALILTPIYSLQTISYVKMNDNKLINKNVEINFNDKMTICSFVTINVNSKKEYSIEFQANGKYVTYKNNEYTISEIPSSYNVFFVEINNVNELFNRLKSNEKDLLDKINIKLNENPTFKEKFEQEKVYLSLIYDYEQNTIL